MAKKKAIKMLQPGDIYDTLSDNVVPGAKREGVISPKMIKSLITAVYTNIADVKYKMKQHRRKFGEDPLPLASLNSSIHVLRNTAVALQAAIKLLGKEHALEKANAYGGYKIPKRILNKVIDLLESAEFAVWSFRKGKHQLLKDWYK